MPLTAAQTGTLKSDITAKSASGQPLNALFAAQNWDGIADYYNTVVTFYVWRTNVSRAEIYTGNPQPENSFWNWTFYKNQSVTEQNAWTQMFMGDQADFSKANVRSGVLAIFTAGSAVNATHAFAVARRQANRVEQLLASGTGTTAAPAVLGFEGMVSGREILDTVNS